MKFLLDQNISLTTAEFLLKLGINAKHVSKLGLKGKTDKKIYEYTRKEKYILVTFDQGFGFKYLSKKDLEGLIIIRIHPQTIENLHPVLKNFFLKVKKGKLKVKKRLIIVEKGKIRSRKVVQTSSRR